MDYFDAPFDESGNKYGWHLTDVTLDEHEFPENADAPTETERRAVQVGWSVQVYVVNDTLPRAERLWLRVTDRDDDGSTFGVVPLRSAAWVGGFDMADGYRIEARHIHCINPLGVARPPMDHCDDDLAAEIVSTGRLSRASLDNMLEHPDLAFALMSATYLAHSVERQAAMLRYRLATEGRLPHIDGPIDHHERSGPPTDDQIKAVYDESWWYLHEIHTVGREASSFDRDSAPKISPERVHRGNDLQAEFGTLYTGAWPDYEVGYAHGKAAALNWVLTGHWDPGPVPAPEFGW